MDDKDKGSIVIAAKVAELVKTCPRFGRDDEFDWCNEHCDLCDFCDKVHESMDVSKIE